MMVADCTLVRSAEGFASGLLSLPAGGALALTLRVRLTTPGEACIAVASSVAFAYTPSLPDDIAVRLDDRLYDGLYDGLAAAEGALPPERLRMAVVSLISTPPLSTLLDPVDWLLVGVIGDYLATLAAEAFGVAWPGLLHTDNGSTS